MNRRGFLKAASGLFLAAGAGQIVLPEEPVRRFWQGWTSPEYNLVWYGNGWHAVPLPGEPWPEWPANEGYLIINGQLHRLVMPTWAPTVSYEFNLVE